MQIRKKKLKIGGQAHPPAYLFVGRVLNCNMFSINGLVQSNSFLACQYRVGLKRVRLTCFATLTHEPHSHIT